MSSDSRLLWMILANQQTMIGMLQRILNEESDMAVDVSKLTAEVQNNSTVTGSVIALLQQLTTMINNIPPTTDKATQDAIDQLAATLSANDQTIADAVVANTPAAQGGPTQTSAPTSGQTSAPGV